MPGRKGRVWEASLGVHFVYKEGRVYVSFVMGGGLVMGDFSQCYILFD